MNKTLSIFTDGGARGNPGPAASGVSIVNSDGKELAAVANYIGIATNNIAEYKAVLLAFDWLFRHTRALVSYTDIAFFLDSQLVCFQLQGKYRVKNQALATIVAEIQKKRKELLLPVSFSHIPRSQNKRADQLVNMALDKKIESFYN